MSLPAEVLTFHLGIQKYAIDVAAIQEIRSYEQGGSRNPDLPEYFRGLLNLRGVLVPLVDLRIFNFLEDPSCTPFTVTLITYFEDFVMGLVVDGVGEVTDFTPCQPSGEAVSLPLGEFLYHTIALPDGEYSVLLLDHQKLLQKLREELSGT